MTRAFIVEIDVDAIDDLSLQMTSEDIEDTLVNAGFDVIKVHAWAGQDGPAESLTIKPIEPPSLFDTLNGPVA